MDIHLTDLDALALRVREPRSRDYVAEAIRSYRAGAYKAAIVATYVAVTYDVAMKIRELAATGEAGAVRFIADLDRAIENDSRDRLLRIEGNLIDEAFNTYQFLGAQEHSQMTRLKEDRNLCAHPAFASENELFQPSPELVRSHIVHAVTMLLSQPPVQGRAAIAAFAADVASASFPTAPELAVHYVTARYLERMRPNLVTNLATVIVKGLVREDVEGWRGNEPRLLNALTAIARFRPEIWETVVRDTSARLLPSLDDAQRLRAFRLFGFDPRFWQHADEATKAQFAALLDNLGVNPDQEAVFAALGLAELRDPMMRAFAKADQQRKLSIIARHPHEWLVDGAIEVLAGARSYRGAEALFASAITPLAGVIDEAAAARILQTTKGNSRSGTLAEYPRCSPTLRRLWPSVTGSLRGHGWTSLNSFDPGDRNTLRTWLPTGSAACGWTSQNLPNSRISNDAADDGRAPTASASRMSPGEGPGVPPRPRRERRDPAGHLEYSI